MTDSHIKENLSRHFVSTLASINGLIISESKNDYGTDFKINQVVEREENGHLRYMEKPNSVSIQLKSTTEDSIERDNEHRIVYDLDIKNYNDLILANNSYGTLILILFILPNDKMNWVECLEDGIKICKCAYWYKPNENDTISNNAYTQRIKIPDSNLLNIDSFYELVNEIINSD
jgi:hypothetical protein